MAEARELYYWNDKRSAGNGQGILSPSYDIGLLDTDTHTHIQRVKGIARKQARTIDARREKTRKGHKKAQAVEIPDELPPLLKHPEAALPNVTRC